MTLPHTTDDRDGWEREFDELMFNLPVNDWRVTHLDLINNEDRLTFRGETIKSFIRKTIEAARSNERERCVGALVELVTKERDGWSAGKNHTNIAMGAMAALDKILLDLTAYLTRPTSPTEKV